MTAQKPRHAYKHIPIAITHCTFHIHYFTLDIYYINRLTYIYRYGIFCTLFHLYRTYVMVAISGICEVDVVIGYPVTAQ